MIILAVFCPLSLFQFDKSDKYKSANNNLLSNFKRIIMFLIKGTFYYENVNDFQREMKNHETPRFKHLVDFI